MSRHRMVKWLIACKKSITGYPISNDDHKKMQGLNTQMEEMQRESEHQGHQIYSTEMEFSEPVPHVMIRPVTGHVTASEPHNMADARSSTPPK
jgi:hypothetical protein